MIGDLDDPVADAPAGNWGAPDAALRKVLDDWGVPPAEIVSKLPRSTCKDCSRKSCTQHKQSRCAECGAWIGRHVHLDFVGHAEVTRILIDIDPTWSWEPQGWTEQGTPAISHRDGTLALWGRLTLLGHTRIGVGTCEATKPDAEKELIGDLLRNCAMRFGVALSLWSSVEWDHGEIGAEEIGVLIPVDDAKRRVIAACGGDADLAREMWGGRSTPITEDDLASILGAIG